jgi:hypothetical protein
MRRRNRPVQTDREKRFNHYAHLERLGRVMLIRREPPAEELEAYLGLKPEEIAQIVLLLLMREGAQQKLSALVSDRDQLPQKPAA